MNGKRNDKDIILNVVNLKTYFPVKAGLWRKTLGYIKAVDDVSFSIRQGQVFGLVGESGCGKSTVARTVVRLEKATFGKVYFNDLDVINADKKDIREFRRNVSLVFQDPYSSLNPRMTVGNIIGEPVKTHKIAKGEELYEKVADILERVGLSPEYINRYPHEFSGGQRQRISIARALALNPELVICDEPVSALDVSIQAQILNLLKDIQAEFDLTLLFIAHDLAVVQFFCDVIAVMYLGKIVEQAESRVLYERPFHPYTEALMSAIPQIDPSLRKKRVVPKGEVPSIANPPSGCPFHPRCRYAQEKCSEIVPELEEKGDGHIVACHFPLSK
ncbi:MAG: ATP-binding cassette domain-containing protein [Deltaproteobacteria bacterium]|nr:ATP-binding cassette domain-containing protein [Deltaproteobacteria bacterium]